jgi:hypothetical protein
MQGSDSNLVKEIFPKLNIDTKKRPTTAGTQFKVRKPFPLILIIYPLRMPWQPLWKHYWPARRIIFVVLNQMIPKEPISWKKRE